MAGKTVTIDNIIYTIVGVAPKEFFGTTVGTAPDLFIPLSMEKQLPPAHWDGRNDPAAQSLYLPARRAARVDPMVALRED